LAEGQAPPLSFALGQTIGRRPAGDVACRGARAEDAPATLHGAPEKRPELRLLTRIRARHRERIQESSLDLLETAEACTVAALGLVALDEFDERGPGYGGGGTVARRRGDAGLDTAALRQPAAAIPAAPPW